MITTTQEQQAIDYVASKYPHAKFSSGINWHWMHGFKSNVEADEFDQYCRNNNLETRGVYSNQDGTADVRFRY